MSSLLLIIVLLGKSSTTGRWTTVGDRLLFHSWAWCIVVSTGMARLHSSLVHLSLGASLPHLSIPCDNQVVSFNSSWSLVSYIFTKIEVHGLGQVVVSSRKRKVSGKLSPHCVFNTQEVVCVVSVFDRDFVPDAVADLRLHSSSDKVDTDVFPHSANAAVEIFAVDLKLEEIGMYWILC